MLNIFLAGKNSLNVTEQLLNLLKENHISACAKTIGGNADIENYEDISVYSIMSDTQIKSRILKNNKNIFVFTDCSFYEKISKSFSDLEKEDYIVAYSDFFPLKDYFDEIKANLITYGTNRKSTLTASSISENNDFILLQICVQRTIKTAYNIDFLEQEFSVKANKDIDINSTLALISVLILLGFATGSMDIIA